MSDSLAIAAVTTTLRDLLDLGINANTSGTTVTTRPLDRAREGENGNQVNLFLYHTIPDAAWRNRDIPWRVRPGETGYPPLALSLYYMITAFYGETDDNVDTTTDSNRLLGSHRLLGKAMSVLHDHPLLDMEAINSVLPPDDLQRHAYDQVENVRINPQPLSLDEMSKLWSGFQTEYRLSAAYEVSVVLIESSRPQRTPLPVLRRGVEDRGAFVLASLSPSLREIHPPDHKPVAELGDTLSVLGENLEGEGLTARLRHNLLDDPIELPPLPGRTSSQLQIDLPDTNADPDVPSKFPAGIYTLSLVVERPPLPYWTTNALPFALAPQITITAPLGNTAPQGDLTVKLECIPQVRSGQHASLLFGDREVPVKAENVDTPADPTAPSTLAFIVENALPGEYVLRLRVDGVDSLPVDFTAIPPQFAADQTVTITP
ncbi:MAG: DUF4255 domain-containing protein [Anaerolineales bacterium]|jgi:hypothetical protein